MPTADADVHLDPSALATQMAADVRSGLAERPRTLPPKYFYDARSSELFDEITRLPEYYPTRTERAILDRNVEEIARVSAAETLVELGSGTCRTSHDTQGGWSRSSARPSATSTLLSGPRSSRTCAAASSRVARSSSAPTWSRTRDASWRPTTT